MDTKRIKRAASYLRKADPRLGLLVNSLPRPEVKLHKNYFEALVSAIISQQLSDKAAKTIFNRFRALYAGRTFPKPEQVAGTPLPKLRRAGLSLAKASYVKLLARAVARKEMNLPLLARLTDEQVIAELVKLKGVGVWTAEMFLIFSLGREDVFSAGDLGLQNAVKKLYKLKSHPSHERLHKIARTWRPYRSYACLYLWASLK